MQRKILMAAMAVMLLVAAWPGTAGAAEVGASGQCYDSDQSGGEDETAVNSSSGVTILSVTGTANALVALADDPSKVPSGNGCDRYDCDNDPDSHIESCDTDGDGVPDKQTRKDYLEVHAEGQGEQFQVCYDGQSHQGSTYACPTSPGGPGGPALPLPSTDDTASLLL